MGAPEIIFVHNGDAKIIAVRALANQAVNALAAFLDVRRPITPENRIARPVSHGASESSVRTERVGALTIQRVS